MNVDELYKSLEAEFERQEEAEQRASKWDEQNGFTHTAASRRGRAAAYRDMRKYLIALYLEH